MIHCIKANLHCHTDEISVGGRWHTSAYPVGEALRLFRQRGFDALGITEHDDATSRLAVEAACRIAADAERPMIIVSGHERDAPVPLNGRMKAFHVLELLADEGVVFRVLNHPIRTAPDADLTEVALGMRDAYGLDAVELDMLAPGDPSILARYDDMKRRTSLPVICNSDFHSDLADLPNHFTVYLCDRPDAAGIVKAAREGRYVGFQPDRAAWRLRAWPGASQLAAEWMAAEKPERFTRRFDEFTTIDPPVRPERMSTEDIGRFHQCEPLVLRGDGVEAAVLPERGGRLAGLWIEDTPAADPFANAFADTDSRAEVYEAMFAPYQIIEAGRAHAVLECRLANHPGHAGLTVRKTYGITNGALRVTSQRANRSRAPIETRANLRSRFLKPWGSDAGYRVESPTREEYHTPVNAFLPCEGLCRFTFTSERYALEMECLDPFLASLSLWARAPDGWALVMFDFKPMTLGPGDAGPEHTVTLTPRRRPREEIPENRRR